jgi:methylated-DNA-[protein]-cysteine S-methyltransferase
MIYKGTKFQIKVWKFLKTIPKGTVTTYSKVAEAIGYPKAVRAVANAIGNNPNPIIVPCHRVVRSDGTIGGYSGIGGIKKKKALLKKENIKLNQILRYIK